MPWLTISGRRDLRAFPDFRALPRGVFYLPEISATIATFQHAASGIGLLCHCFALIYSDCSQKAWTWLGRTASLCTSNTPNRALWPSSRSTFYLWLRVMERTFQIQSVRSRRAYALGVVQHCLRTTYLALLAFLVRTANGACRLGGLVKLATYLFAHTWHSLTVVVDCSSGVPEANLYFKYCSYFELTPQTHALQFCCYESTYGTPLISFSFPHANSQ